MAWNEPGGGKDPWGGNNKGGDGPPDLDEALQKLRARIDKLFGGSKGGSGGSDGNGGAGSLSGNLVAVVFAVLALVWAATGLYQVDAKEKAVVLRLGEFLETKGEGLRWNPKFIDQVYVVEVTNVRDWSAKGSMLTEDENIVDVPVSVQYDIKDVKAFVLNVNRPITSLKHATDSAVRHVVGSTNLDSVLGDGREVMAAEVEQRLQAHMDDYGTGINIVKVNILKAEAPSQVKAAFDDVIAAKEDKDRLKEQAEAYKNGIIPEARGAAKRMSQDAEAYKQQVIANATGEASRFEKLLSEYKQAPVVTRERLYIESVQDVMSNTSKVMVDTKGEGNIMYLPLDKLMGANGAASPQNPTTNSALVDQVTNQVMHQLRKAQEEQYRGRVR